MSDSQPNDFAADVLAELLRRKITFRGLRPESLKICVNGTLEVWFAGFSQDDAYLRKSIRIIDPFPINQAVHMGKPEVIATITEQIIDHNSARYF